MTLVPGLDGDHVAGDADTKVVPHCGKEVTVRSGLSGGRAHDPFLSIDRPRGRIPNHFRDLSFGQPLGGRANLKEDSEFHLAPGVNLRVV